MINITAVFLRAWYIHNMSNNTVMKYVMKPAICGIVGKLAASMFIGVDGSGSLPFAGMDWAPSTVIGISVAGATAAAAATHDIVLVRVQSMGYSESTEKIIAPALAAAFTIAAVRFTVGPLGDLRSIFELAAIGGGSEVGGTYLHDVLMPLMSSPHTVQAMR
jgi:hypothetical protein